MCNNQNILFLCKVKASLLRFYSILSHYSSNCHYCIMNFFPPIYCIILVRMQTKTKILLLTLSPSLVIPHFCTCIHSSLGDHIQYHGFNYICILMTHKLILSILIYPLSSICIHLPSSPIECHIDILSSWHPHSPGKKMILLVNDNFFYLFAPQTFWNHP